MPDPAQLSPKVGRSYPLPAALAHIAAERDLVAQHKPSHWKLPSLGAVPVAITAAEIAEAEAELEPRNSGVGGPLLW